MHHVHFTDHLPCRANGTIAYTGSAFSYNIPNVLDAITIFGATLTPSSLLMNGAPLAGATVSRNATSGVVTLSNMALSMTSPWTLQLVSLSMR
jgi:hypothetical protein